eukprot:7397508-Alexandrium_andersonii.AAC.1
MAVARGSRGDPRTPWTTPRADRAMTGAHPAVPKACAIPRSNVPCKGPSAWNMRARYGKTVTT